jgi:hypothetical protein
MFVFLWITLNKSKYTNRINNKYKFNTSFIHSCVQICTQLSTLFIVLSTDLYANNIINNIKNNNPKFLKEAKNLKPEEKHQPAETAKRASALLEDFMRGELQKELF